MITESQIKAGLRAATTAEKRRLELRDSGGPRGAGRLVLIIRGNGEGADPSAEFYACWYRDGHRAMSKSVHTQPYCLGTPASASSRNSRPPRRRR
jgi:hypothetical protein